MGADVINVATVTGFEANVSYLNMGGKRISFVFQDGPSAGVGTMVVEIRNPLNGAIENRVNLPYAPEP